MIEALPGSHEELVTPGFFASIQQPDAPIRAHLRENSLEDICLDGPIRWYHMVDDDEVPDTLAQESAAALAGCNDIELIPWTGKDHLNTWHQTLPRSPRLLRHHSTGVAYRQPPSMPLACHEQPSTTASSPAATVTLASVNR